MEKGARYTLRWHHNRIDQWQALKNGNAFWVTEHLPAIGGPAILDMPRANVTSPKALVNFSSPNNSHKIMDVSDMKAAEKKTKWSLDEQA